MEYVKTTLIALLLLVAGQADAAFNHYLGVGFHGKTSSFKSNFGGEDFKRNLKGYHGFLGTKLNDVASIELGHHRTSWSKKKFNHHRFSGPYVNAHWHFFTGSFYNLFAGVGVSHLKLETQKKSDKFQTRLLRKPMPRVLAGAEWEITEWSALRLSAMFEPTRRIKGLGLRSNNTGGLSADIILKP